MIKIIDAKTITAKKKKTANNDAKTMINDGEKVCPMTYDEACKRIMEFEAENKALKDECKKLTSGCQDLSDANQRLNKTCNDILAEKANLQNDFDALKDQKQKLADIIKKQTNDLFDKEKLFNATLDIAVLYQHQRKRFRLGFFITLLALFFENAWLFGSNLQTLIDWLK